MKIKTLLAVALCAITTNVNAQTKLVGGDLSLVPAYEAAGDLWLDADGNTINSYYDDGMITYVRDVAGWNAVRVRLLVDPTQDDAPATCQDIEYVKKLGKRVKDAGMNFLLDIFYSDTWTDVSQQWIPASWGYNRNTATATLAAKVKSYTTEVLNTLVSYGAKPDYIQIGNEVSYGMLWDNATGKSKNKWFITSGTYADQQANIERFTALLKAAAEGVRASNCASAKIVLHCERTVNASHVSNFYSWVNQAGFSDYDVIGLSYYPLWHGDLNKLKTTLTVVQTKFPTKEIQIVETGYHFTTPYSIGANDFDTSSTWPYTPAGQASFLADLIAMLNSYTNVNGLYYWQPEECGNGADEDGNNRVMGNWDNRGFWDISWKSGTHALNSKAALMTLKAFLGSEDPQESDVTSSFENMDFENGESNLVWTVDWNLGWNSNPWPATDSWASSLTSGYILKSWAQSASNLSAGPIFYQSKDNMPAGTYTITAVVHTDYDGIYLFANDDTKIVPATSAWGTAYTVSVSTTLTETGTLTFGLTLPSKPTSTSEVNLYADNFTCVVVTTGIDLPEAEVRQDTDKWYTLNGMHIGKPTRKGIYIHQRKKTVIE